MSDYKLFDWVNSLSYGKDLELSDYNHHQYTTYMINLAFSQHQDTIIYASTMNQYPDLCKQAHFGYMNNVIRKRKRYGKWAKETKNDDLDVIMEFYPHMSREKAKTVLPLLQDEIEDMKEKLYKGGRV